MRRRSENYSPEQLEIRTLLTVNVTFNAGTGLLKLNGDGAGDNINISNNGGGGLLAVTVNAGVTQNFSGVLSIKASLGDGDDTLNLNAIRIGGNVTADLGRGADEFDVDATGDFTVIGGSMKVNLGGDSGDFFELDDGIRIFKNLTVNGVADVDIDGDGTLFTPEVDLDVIVFGNFVMNFVDAADTNSDNLEADIDNLFVGGKTTINGSNDIERIEITLSQFTKAFTINADDGDDVVDLDNGAGNKNRFESNATFRGGDDNDTFFKGVNNDFLRPEVVTGFEVVV